MNWGWLLLLAAVAAWVYRFWMRRPIRQIYTENFSDNDEEMNEAIAKAQENLDEFITMFNHPQEWQTVFTLKARFRDSRGCFEHIWLTPEKMVEGGFTGTIDNDPVNVPGMKAGTQVTVKLEDISDWMIMEGERLRGGYTTEVQFKRMGRPVPPNVFIR